MDFYIKMSMDKQMASPKYSHIFKKNYFTDILQDTLGFGGFQRRPTLSKSKSEDCDYYTDSLCLNVGNYPK